MFVNIDHIQGEMVNSTYMRTGSSPTLFSTLYVYLYVYIILNYGGRDKNIHIHLVSDDTLVGKSFTNTLPNQKLKS